MTKYLVFLAIVLSSFNLFGQTYPYQDPNLSSEERAKDLVSRLTLEEKAILMCDISEAIPRLGIKKFNWWSEALHGHANQEDVTVFPEPIGMAASFDDELVQKVFSAVSDEVRANYNEAKKNGEENERFLSLSVWTPNINIFRDPRWGRGQETYGEDPYLMSRMGSAVVRGLQGPEDSRYKKLLACAKHYAVHSGPEWARHTMNVVDVTPRDLWETYLPAFKALVQEADVREVMCAYQRLNDDPCCGSTRLLQRILREDWGFEYLVVSDCGAVADFWQNHKVSSDATHAAARASLTGTDIECGFGYAYEKLPEAVKLGLIKESDIDKNIERVLRGRFDLGEMDADSLVSWSSIPKSVVNNQEHRDLALEVARESITLLQNKDDILPLPKTGKKIAVVGPNADNERMMWGNYNGTPVRTITVLEGIKSKLGEENIIYDQGCDIVEDMMMESILPESSIDGKTGIKGTYWNNEVRSGEPVTTEQYSDMINLTTAGQHEFSKGVKLKGFSAKYETVYKADESGELVLKIEASGRCDIYVNGDSLYSYNAWYPQPARILFDVEEGKDYKFEFLYKTVNDWLDASLKFDIGKEYPIDFNSLVEKLQDIEVVVFVGGISPMLEGEEMAVSLPGFKGGDRTDIELPLSQRKCLNALIEAGKKVVFVNCSGSAVGLVPESENYEAILQAWYGGEAGGQAVADVLFGDYNPAGKLPVTFYKNINQLPDYEDYSMEGRTYRYMSDPLFPFGYGLSYTTFDIGDGRIDKSKIGTSEGVILTVPVSNSGEYDGAEVIQVYLRNSGDSEGPLKTLRGFERVTISAGETKDVVIELPASAFECFDEETQSMKVMPGEYELLYGTSSADKDLKSIEVTII